MKREISPEGKHIIADLYGCDLSQMTSKRRLEEMIREAVEKAQMDLISLKIKKMGNKKSPGYSGFAFLLQSHLSFHCWDEYFFCQIDIFTCGKKSKPEEAFRVILKYLNPAKIRKISLKRNFEQKA